MWMQRILIHSDLQIFKKLNILNINMCALNMLCGNLQSFRQIYIDEITLT